MRSASARCGPATDGAGNHRILDGFLTASRKSLDVMSRTLDEARSTARSTMLAGAETIYILARRRSYPVASYLAYALGKLGVRNQLVESAAGLDPEMIAFATPKDAVARRQLLALCAGDHRGRARPRRARRPAGRHHRQRLLAAWRSFARLWFEVAEADFGGFRTLSSTMALAMALAVGIGDARRSRRGKGRRRGQALKSRNRHSALTKYWNYYFMSRRGAVRLRRRSAAGRTI